MSIQSEAALEAGLIATLQQMDYEYVQIDVGVGQCLLGNLVQTQIEQAHLQAAAHQKLHAEVVDLLGAGADSLGLELFVVLAHHLTADQSQRAVDLLVGGNIQLHTVFVYDINQKICKSPSRIHFNDAGRPDNEFNLA